MRVLVAGGAGFLGSHLCDRLVGRGDVVVCVDDLSTGRPENLVQLDGQAGFTFVEADVSQDVPVDGAFDAVCNLASPASPPAFLERPLATLAVGSEGTRRLLEVADRSGARFLLASTSEVYGEPMVHPQVEQYRGNVDPVGLRSVYDEAKRFAEALTMATHRARGVPVRIARIFNTYGPRFVSNFVVQALAGQPLTVYGDGSQTRSLCYVDDLVSGLLALLDSDETGPVNIGNPDERTVLDLAHEVIAATGSSSVIEHRPLPTDDPTRRCPDIGLARRVLGWEPQVDLDVGLARTVAYLAGLPDTGPSGAGPGDDGA
jgi:dTDP-glucose 4,6-dehydratase